MRHARGHSLVELLVAMGILAAVTGSLFGLLNPAHAASSVQPEVADMQQRLRVAADTLTRDLLMAGAGSHAGVPAVALNYYQAAVFPYRVGVLGAEAGGTFHADVTTIRYVAAPDSGCGYAVFEEDPACLFSRTYFLKSDPAKKLYQLMAYDGGANADVPVVDHVVGLSFDYFGDPQPPALLAATCAASPVTPCQTYGPGPPPAGVQTSAYPPGENCVFSVDPLGGVQLPRLGVLGGDPGRRADIHLAPSVFTDGPWCPDAAAADRFDADLLRIRRVSVTLRVESANDALRGPAGALFTHGGTATDASRRVPDQEVSFDVAPRNLNLRR